MTNDVVIDLCREEISAMQELLGFVVEAISMRPEVTLGKFGSIFAMATSAMFRGKGCSQCDRVCEFRGCDKTQTVATEVDVC